MLHLSLQQGDGVPLYLQLIQQIKHLVATGRLAPDSELPPVRVLAQQLLINPNTVVRAYRELEIAGLVYKRRGEGTYVSSRGTPYTPEECRRILAQKVEALLIEGRHLGFDEEKIIDLVRECESDLQRRARANEGVTI
ncbi:MAG: GntR family transcriptional regulator [Candidatus Hydrogenedentes bacterium]|nr:GntR family transcriptional regulator [Candidatus Hydrogenedentota bacterium]